MVKDMFGKDRAPSQCCGAAIVNCTTPTESYAVCSKCSQRIKPEMAEDENGKRVLCVHCGEPIRLDEFAGATAEGLWHNTFPCVLALGDIIKKNEEKEDEEIPTTNDH